jgi:multidrug efflux pump subunit AcrA (membrane-fusion protein)
LLRVRITLGIVEPMTSHARLACAALLISGLAPLLAGCDEPPQAVASAPAQTSEPEVSVVTVAPRARAVVRELPGRIAPTRVADVRPRVSGIVVQRTFNQGSEVKAGDILYRIRGRSKSNCNPMRRRWHGQLPCTTRPPNRRSASRS